MECRIRGHVPTLLLALGLTMGGLGCIQSSTQTTATVLPQGASVSKAAPAKRNPKPATCVAWAVCRERQAEKEANNPALKRNLYDEATLAYKQALEIDPEHISAYAGLARIYMQQGQFATALETYNEALQKKPKEAALWFDLGICHCRAKQWEQAIRSLEKALELDKDNRRLTQTLGFCLARAGHLNESRDTLCRVMNPAEASYHVARMMRHMQRDDLCQQYLREALQIDPNLAAARSLLASLEERGANSAANACPADPGEVSLHGHPPLVQINFEAEN